MTKISDAHEAELLASADEKPARASARVKKTKKSRKDTDIIDITATPVSDDSGTPAAPSGKNADESEKKSGRRKGFFGF